MTSRSWPPSCSPTSWLEGSARGAPDAYAVDPGLVKTGIAAKENSRIVRAIWRIRTRNAISRGGGCQVGCVVRRRALRRLEERACTGRNAGRWTHRQNPVIPRPGDGCGSSGKASAASAIPGAERPASRLRRGRSRTCPGRSRSRPCGRPARHPPACPCARRTGSASSRPSRSRRQGRRSSCRTAREARRSSWQSVHSYSKIGMAYSRRPSRSLRQITRMRLYRPSPSLTVSMSP